MKKYLLIAMLACLPAVAQAAPQHKSSHHHGPRVVHCHGHHAKPAPRPKHHRHHARPKRHHGPHCAAPAPRPCPPPPVHHCNGGSRLNISINL